LGGGEGEEGRAVREGLGKGGERLQKLGEWDPSKIKGRCARRLVGTQGRGLIGGRG